MGTRVLAGFGLATLVMIGVGGLSYRLADGIHEHLDDMADERLPALTALLRVREAQTLATRGMNALFIPKFISDLSLRKRAHVLVDAGFEHLHTSIKDYETLHNDEHAQGFWRTARRALDTWEAKAQTVYGLVQEQERAFDAGDTARAAEVHERAWSAYLDMRDAYDPVAEALTAAIGDAEGDTKAVREEGAAMAERGIAIIAGAVAAGALALLLLGVAIARSIGNMVQAVAGQANRLRAAVDAGELDVRGSTAAISPEFHPIVDGMNATMDAFVQPIRMTAEYVTRISTGDVPPPIAERYEGDFNQIKDALNRCIASINALIQDSLALSRAGVEGKLSTRADASRHQGDFRRIVQGVNDTLDAVVGPLTVSARCVDQIAKGQIPERISAAWAGDFEVLQRNLNTCIDAINALIRDAHALAAAAVQGQLATRADASRHQGDFRKIVEGVNATLDAVVGPLTVAARCVEQISRGEIPARIDEAYAGDFARIRDNLNTCIDAVNALLRDTSGLVQAALSGQLASRADASRHQGDFRKVVDGVNRTLDAVIAPVTDATAVLERLATRDLRARMEGRYQGDHAKLEVAVNATAEALHEALEQVVSAVDQVSSAATQIASSSQSVASGASEQAAALEETSSSLDSVAAMTQQAATNAQQASILVRSARAAAGEGASAVEELQRAMGRITQSAEGTSQIIKDVSDIAFQTNLLALNAAVEAARAGDAGRGFAVVAEEVRSLALRAKEAAGKTEELIRQSLKEAGEGQGAATRVTGKLSEIAQGVEKVTAIVTEMATSAKEQASGITQVTSAVGEMDKVTQQNAASAEESSSAASELSGQAEELAAMIGTFQLGRLAVPHRLDAPPRPHRNGKLQASPAPASRTSAKRLFPLEDEPGTSDF